MNDKYLHFKVEDFAADQDFIDWVITDKNQSEWQTWLLQHAELNNIISEARSFVNDLNFKFEELDKNKREKVWQNIDLNTKVKSTIIRKLLITLAAAAACLTIFYVNSFHAVKLTKLDSVAAKMMEYSLPDASKIIIQQGSMAEYDKNKFDKNRIVKLQGQAFFNVKKGSSFTVETKYGNIEVLGTSFNVSTANNTLNVHCYTGKVKVTNGKNNSLLLPGEKINITTEIEKSKFEIYDDLPLWLDSEVVIKSKTVKQICQLLQEIYKKKIITDKGVDMEASFSGALNTQNIDEALKTFTWPLKLKYKINGDEVKILKE